MKVKPALIAVVVVFSHTALAAKPTSITFKETKTNSEGEGYQLYVVKCSDGEGREITAWNNRKLWCVGESISEDKCDKKQIKVAKTVCKSG